MLNAMLNAVIIMITASLSSILFEKHRAIATAAYGNIDRNYSRLQKDIVTTAAYS